MHQVLPFPVAVATDWSAWKGPEAPLFQILLALEERSARLTESLLLQTLAQTMMEQALGK